MPDFRALVRAQVAPLHLSSEREETVVEEYTLNIEDVYGSLLQDGFSADAAWDELQRRIPSWPEWRQQLLAADPNSRAVVGALARSSTADGARIVGHAPRRASVFATVTLLPLAIRRDLTVAVRALARNRASVLAAMASVGIAVGVAGAAVGVATALYAWHPAVAAPDRLVFISRADASGNDDHQLTPDEFRELRQGARHVGVLGGVLGWRDSVRTIRAAEHTFTAVVAEAGGDFDELGLQPVIGRGFRADELRAPIGDTGFDARRAVVLRVLARALRGRSECAGRAPGRRWCRGDHCGRDAPRVHRPECRDVASRHRAARVQRGAPGLSSA